MAKRKYDIVDSDLGWVEDSPKNKYGQYFTPPLVADFMIDLADINSSSDILEPSAGEGIFLEKLIERGCKNLMAYEIDPSLGQQFDCVKYESFVSASISKKYDLIIGNPPYIRWKNLEDELKEELAANSLWNTYFNSLCDYLYIFILKSIEILKDEGQLIFICPEYWMNTTHSAALRNYMVDKGYFEKIYHFNETPIFNNATVSVVIFKYIKSKRVKPEISVTKYFKNRVLSKGLFTQIREEGNKNSDVERFTVRPFERNSRWLLTNQPEKKLIDNFEKACSTQVKDGVDLFHQKATKFYPTIGDVCDIGNGMVSGLDKAFQLNGEVLNELEETKLLKVIKAKDLRPYRYTGITRYIFADDIESETDLKERLPNFYEKLGGYRERLDRRYDYNKEIPYWRWVFLRNYNLFNSPVARIFVPCKERISNKDYFRFAYVEDGIFPTQDVTAIFKKEATKESLHYILAFLNYPLVFIWLKNKGIIKGNIVEFSERPISTIPFRKIDWQNPREVEIHHDIVNFTKRYIAQGEEADLETITELLTKLLGDK